MRCFEKDLPGFKVIFLHDPFSCHKCVNVMTGEDFDFTLCKCKPLQKSDELKKSNKLFKSRNVHSPQRKKESPLHSKVLSQKPFGQSLVNIKVVKNRNKHMLSKESEVSTLLSHKKPKAVKKLVKKVSPKKEDITSMNKEPSTSDKKMKDSKVPGKGTLKRKRWFLNKLNCKNDNYEDDLFEDQKFGHFQSLFEDETDSGEQNFEGVKTPILPFSISPKENTPSPPYKDCYSPTELSRSRKGAEEYQYRRRRRRKLCLADEKIEAPQIDQQLREADVLKRLEEVARILDLQKKNASDSEEDEYYSDVLANS